MGYAIGVRPGGHAGGHLREPALELLEAICDDETRWWEVDSGNGVPFESPEAAYRHLGRLWHCTDTVPGDDREMAEDLLGTDHVWTYAALVRHLRPFIVRELRVMVSR
jgi:hypothetical protein